MDDLEMDDLRIQTTIKNILENKLVKTLLYVLGIIIYVYSFIYIPNYESKLKKFSPKLEINLTKNAVDLEYINVPKHAKNANLQNETSKYTYSFFSNDISLEKVNSTNIDNSNVLNYNIGNLDSNKNNMYRVVCSQKNSNYKVSFNFKTEKQAENFEDKFKKFKNEYDKA